ncbi:MAG TPA: hypothetical protein DHW42_10155, partial [Candidatus Marinimicrobia bacterium]|nr:hypothetical protein [Candidatus Neomarinimicrobiota bacterium]
MNYTHYDFEGLWIATYQKIMYLNSKMNGTGLDKSQLKEVTTSVFIAKVQKGIVRPNDEDDYDFPEPEEAPLLNRNNGNGSAGNGSASEKQISTIKSLLKNPKVNPDERRRITKLLAGDLEKQTASDMLDYFFVINVNYF